MTNVKKTFRMKRTGNKIPKTIGRLLVLVLLPFASTGQDTVKITRHEFSIQQAIDYANKNNVNVKNALLDIKLQEQVNREITSRGASIIDSVFKVR